ncbi:MAG: tripartite tricarboxylate transporter TctB family protein [Casimicrobiaceae bacterium]
MMVKLKQSVPYWVTLAFAAYLYHVAQHISAPDTGGQLGPDFWPKAVLALMMAVCVYAIGRILAAGKVPAEPLDELMEGAAAEHADDAPPPQRHYPLLLIAGVILTFVYVALFEVLGFFLDTCLLLFAFILIGRYRRLGIALVVSLVGTLVFMFVFMKIVYVPLPIGSPPFSEVSILLMKLMGIR